MPINSILKNKQLLSPIIAYSIMYFFLALGDSLVSYGAPVLIENHVKDTLMVGFILSSSSVFGLLFDFFTTRFWPNAKYSKFLKLTFITTASLPILLLLLPTSIPVFLLGMLMWGAYYEFRGFANYAFIQKHSVTQQHTNSWATLNAFSAIAYLIGPVIAVLIIDIEQDYVLWVALATFVIAYFLYLLAKPVFKDKKSNISGEITEPVRTTIEQWKIIITLFKSVWHLFIYTFALYMIDAAFWSIGILYTEQLKDASKLGGLFIVAYMLPSLLTLFVAHRIPKTWSKKRISFITGLLAGTSLIFIGLGSSTISVLVIVLFMAIFYDLSLVMNLAVFEDYVSRLGKFSNDMVGINQAAVSLSYIVGPVLWGFLAQIMGFQRAFALSGVLLASVCVACFFAVPRKVHMPQSSLNAID